MSGLKKVERSRLHLILLSKSRAIIFIDNLTIGSWGHWGVGLLRKPSVILQLFFLLQILQKLTSFSCHSCLPLLLKCRHFSFFNWFSSWSPDTVRNLKIIFSRCHQVKIYPHTPFLTFSSLPPNVCRPVMMPPLFFPFFPLTINFLIFKFDISSNFWPLGVFVFFPLDYFVKT